MLEGSLVVLRAPTDSDRTVLHALRNDLALQAQLMGLPRANSAERVQEWLGRMLGDPSVVFFVVASRADGRTLGYIQLARMDHVHGTADLGICLAEDARGGGRAGEALALLEGYARTVFGLRKILLQVLASNARAIQFYLKAGYDPAGTLARHHYHAGVHHDVRIFEKFLL